MTGQLCITGPIVDPGQAKRLRRADWLVIVKCGDRVEVHRFGTCDEARTFITTLEAIVR